MECRRVVVVAVNAALLGAMLVTTGLALAASSCGSAATDYRLPVKHATDAEAADVGAAAHATTITHLRDNLARPATARPRDAPRQSPVETTIYRLANVRLNEAKKQDDRDYHLVVENAAGKSMIVELVSATCEKAPSARFGTKIAAARTAFDQVLRSPSCHTGTRGDWKLLTGTATIEGIGFFDRPHSHGAAPNGIELHPVLKFTPSC